MSQTQQSHLTPISSESLRKRISFNFARETQQSAMKKLLQDLNEETSNCSESMIEKMLQIHQLISMAIDVLFYNCGLYELYSRQINKDLYVALFELWSNLSQSPSISQKLRHTFSLINANTLFEQLSYLNTTFSSINLALPVPPQQSPIFIKEKISQTLHQTINSLLADLVPQPDDPSILFKSLVFETDLTNFAQSCKKVYPRLAIRELVMYGSTVNGLQIKGGSSDLDMTLIVEETNAYQSEILAECANIMREMEAGKEFKHCKIVDIRVNKRTFGDILDFQLQSKLNPKIKIEASIAVNKHLGVQNSQLIATYCNLDVRFRDLCLILKHLNKITFPQASKRIDSYAFTTMAVAYLQFVGILPKLTLINNDQIQIVKFKKVRYVDKKHTNSEFWEENYKTNIQYEIDLDKIKTVFKPRDGTEHLKVDDLLVGFLDFYTRVFKGEEHCISTSHKEGTLISKREYQKKVLAQFPDKNDVNRIELERKFDEYWFYIVDPFDWTMNYGKRVTKSSPLKDQYLHMMNTNIESLVNTGLLADMSNSTNQLNKSPLVRQSSHPQLYLAKQSTCPHLYLITETKQLPTSHLVVTFEGIKMTINKILSLDSICLTCKYRCTLDLRFFDITLNGEYKMKISRKKEMLEACTAVQSCQVCIKHGLVVNQQRQCYWCYQKFTKLASQRAQVMTDKYEAHQVVGMHSIKDESQSKKKKQEIAFCFKCHKMNMDHINKAVQALMK